MPLFMIRNDITRVKADGIVNPANEKLQEGAGTSRAVFLAAGEEKLQEACRKIGSCKTGKAVITDAFALPAKYVVHAVCPLYQNGKQGESKLLESAYREALLLGVKYKMKSMAFPLLSSGSYGYPKEEALKIAMQVIKEFLMEHEMKVYLVLYDKESVKISRKTAFSLKTYIDEHYVEEKESICRYPESREWYKILKPEECRETAALYSPEKRSLDELLNHMDETFSEMLLRLIDERGLTDAFVYKKANIDRRHFSKIRNQKNYTPGKRTVLAFAIALELSMDETKDLLLRAGYALSGSSRSDVIISYFIENGIYDIFEINEALFAYEEQVLGS